MLILKKTVITAVFFTLFLATLASAGFIDIGNGLAYSSQGTILGNEGDYDWWHGCSPTSAGMMMGYYDRNGYNGLTYNNLVPGGVAEASSFGNTDAIINDIIASDEHIAEYYISGYMGSGDDDPMGDGVPGFHSPNSLADFMGTSQDAIGNENGATTFINWSNGAKLHYSDMVTYGLEEKSGMYGIYEYLDYAGYGVEQLYNQYTDNLGETYGFSFNDYKAEIDAGRVVMLHVEGHSMFGYGYEDDGTVYLHDTWSEGQHSMAWGGDYEGLDMWGVTVMELAGGESRSVPEPSTILLMIFGFGALGVTCRKKRK